ncbi:GTP 3',8-cyclase MoaA [Patulibacter minatonensis]|uniref:GTP 3',8-cyclase MoaA n=1 Tax=Patulibacter minatonensis TaxID=298163 RepID=UPI00055C5A75|nr:GTP 3',8-cyclase MoaA [Patulibacter minatonensis]
MSPERTGTSQAAFAPRPSVPPLADGFGRVVTDLRVSVTDVCNLRCTYCLPESGISWLPKDERLDDDETVRLVEVLAGLGVRTVRVTGGEPLARAHLPALVERLDAVEGIEEISMTTNGVLLARHADALVAAGVSRFNVSIDSVDQRRFAELTRRDRLPAVLEGIAALDRHDVLVKLNAVALKGITEHECVDLVAFARERGLQLRFIEVMPLDADGAWTEDHVLTGEEVRALIHERWPVDALDREPSSTARVFRFRDGGGEVGFVSSVTQSFCGDCDRLRLTADGQLRTCLFSHDETDLRGALRSGASDDELVGMIRRAVAGKQWGHEMHKPGFRPPERPMSAIGG